jgi:hypothetical protein
MIRKFITSAALIALPIGFFATLGAGPAQAASPVTFKGSISCGLTGTITFTPPLANTQTTATTTAKFKGTNKPCKGIDGTKLTQGGETLKSSKDSFSFTVPASTSGSCSALASGAVPPISLAITWVGTSPITATKVVFPAGTISISNGVIEYLKGKSTGSFAGSGQMALQASTIKEGNGTVVPFSVTNAANACAGSGIAALTLVQPNPPPKPFTKNDNLEVGKAF